MRADSENEQESLLLMERVKAKGIYYISNVKWFRIEYSYIKTYIEYHIK